MSPEKIIAAQIEVARLTHELDITNADHIALWLEANMANSPLAWLACRIVEAHEAELAAAKAELTSVRNACDHSEAMALGYAEELAALKADAEMLAEAGKDVINQAFDYYTARNGRRMSIEGDDGEKCWIVPFDPFEHLRAALAAWEKSRDQHD